MTDPSRDLPSEPASIHALNRLADALDSRDYTTTLVSGPGQVPRLTVTSKHADFGDDIYADQQSYWWSFAERIAAVDDPLAAARKVTRVLRTTPAPSRG